MLGIEPTVRAREGKGEEEKSRISVGVHSQRRRKGRKKERKKERGRCLGIRGPWNPQRRRKRKEKEGKSKSDGYQWDLNLLYSPISYWTCIYITCDADTNTSFSVLLHTALQTWSIWPESNKREQNRTTHNNNNTQCLCLPSNALRHDIKVFDSPPPPPVLNLLWKLQFFYRITVIRHHFQKYMISSCILHSYSISDIQKEEVKLCVHIHLDTWSQLHMPITGYIESFKPQITTCMNSVGRTSN